MSDELGVKVPSDLGWDLVDEGFEQAGHARGSDWLAQSSTIAITVVGVGADVTTLILARDSIARFARRVMTWAAWHAEKADISELTLRLDVTHPNDKYSDQHIAVQVSRSGAFSEHDMTKVISSIASMFDYPDQP